MKNKISMILAEIPNGNGNTDKEMAIFLRGNDDEIIGKIDLDCINLPVARISGLFVLERLRGKGHGTTLLDAAIASAKDCSQVKSVSLTTREWLFEWYRKRGFIPSFYYKDDKEYMMTYVF